jgi:anaerobic selenocysteine-containing dehydrogenase
VATAESDTAEAVEAEGETTGTDDTDPAVPAEPAAAPAPTLVSFRSGGPVTVPPLDAYSFRLVATRKLYDQGTLLQASSHLAGLAPGTTARIHPADADRLGIESGARMVVRSSRTSLTLPVHPDSGVPRGAIALVVNQADVRVGDLVGVDGPVTELRIETAP